MKTLICDLNVYDNGHHIAFVNSILSHTARREDLIFLFNGMAATLCKGMEGNDRIFFVPEDNLHPDELGSLRDKMREYRFIRNFALEHGVERVIFLEIDWYQVAIGLSSRPPFRITGIYFRPFHLIPTRGDSLRDSVKRLLYHAKKRFLFHILKFNRKVEPLFLLNDRMAGVRYPSWFRYLPDPVFGGGAGPGGGGSVTIRRQFDIPSSSHIILAFGAMGARKNIGNIVAAYQQANFEGDTVLLIAGKVRADYRGAFNRAIDSFGCNNDGRKRLIVFDTFVDEEHIDLYFSEAGTILLCYSKFYGSSGLMGKAAQHRKTCIVPDCGLLYDLNREYKLGYSVDPENVDSIANALSLAQRAPVEEAGFQRFVRDHHESAFLRTLLTV
ncbi:MAG TPA: glycosyltransferase [Puia sp.]|jgi:glycosyltransferase involved in cell wall biosynthesis|nr:glycosyltransferase [Puia sp.]